jgi:AbrB family looped-hinge helix DNA binding protein
MVPGTGSFYGVATIGSKGQIVIPAEARDEMGLQPGEKVIIFGKKGAFGDAGMVGICPISTAEKFVETLTKHISQTQAALDQAKEEKK